MEIKTKFGPAALIMDSAGNRMGIVKSVVITVKEGDQQPSIVYHVTGNGNNTTLAEGEAIGLMPRGTVSPAAAPDSGTGTPTPASAA